MVIAIYYRRESTYERWKEQGIKSVNGRAYMRPTKQLFYKEINPDSPWDWDDIMQDINKLGYEFDFSVEWMRMNLQNGFTVISNRLSSIGDYVEVWVAEDNTIKEAVKNEIDR